jgi:hypothetical protein
MIEITTLTDDDRGRWVSTGQSVASKKSGAGSRAGARI